MPQFGPVSLSRLATAHPDLQRLFAAVVLLTDCSILCGHRGQQEQNEAFETGKSKLQWPMSRHNSIPSTAVDCSPYPLNWSDTQAFKDLAAIIKSTAMQLGIEVTWGGDWAMRDMDHWQLKTP